MPKDDFIKPEATQSTTVQELDLDIDSWLGAPGADSVVLPAEEKKPTIFTKPHTDLSFLDEEASEGDQDETEGGESKPGKSELDDLLAPPSDEDEQEEESDEPASKKPSRNAADSAFSKAFSKLLDEEFLLPFDDDKDISEYSDEDIRELITENFKEKEKAIRKETQEGFIESLPDEIKYAAKYVAEGGTDIKGMFRALAQVEETRSLDPEVEEDQEAIVRKYYQVRNFFDTAEDLDAEIESLKDLGRLGSMAAKFKPNLDKMENEQVQKTIADQELNRKKQVEASQKYMDNVYEALRPAEINGIKLDKKTQSQLYAGLVQPQYDTLSGKKTNQLGHLLEKYQFVEPNYPLIAEALYLLSDPEAYRSTIARSGKDKATEEVVRKLKTEQSRKTSSSPTSDAEPAKPKLAKPRNIFKR